MTNQFPLIAILPIVSLPLLFIGDNFDDGPAEKIFNACFLIGEICIVLAVPFLRDDVPIQQLEFALIYAVLLGCLYLRWITIPGWYEWRCAAFASIIIAAIWGLSTTRWLEAFAAAGASLALSASALRLSDRIRQRTFALLLGASGILAAIIAERSPFQFVFFAAVVLVLASGATALFASDE